jgi:hypothetical protein
MREFLKFVFGPAPVQRRYRYNAQQQLWCPLCLKWTAPPREKHDGKLTIWIRRARRWFQGKRNHETP